ncbi:hypothetical protein G7046_g3072 [Stylonectria norvegica]|nr:hypothetical protein G7046_g3072 [Stylonectria norvegica]
MKDEPGSSKHCNLDSLPVEILSAVCNYLCLHCQLPHIVDASPHDVARAHEGQQALSRLSRTSKWFRLNAQPVLFHYYHSGTQPDGGFCSHNHKDYSLEAKLTTARCETDNLEAFLRTLLQRPDLANFVKALAFFAFRAARVREVAPTTQALLRQASERVGFRDLVAYDQVDAKWLQEMTMMVAPFLDQLLLSRSSREGLQYLRDSHLNLPNLKYLVLAGRDHDNDGCYHIQEIQDLLVKADNLEVLAATDCDSGSDIPLRERFRIEPWGVSLSTLRALSLHSLDPSNLSKILDSCPALEDLEYFCDVGRYTVMQRDHLSSVRNTLRRFCYTGTTWEHTLIGRHHIIDMVSLFLTWDRSLSPHISFGDFPCLEILEIEQMFLYGPVFYEEQRAQRLEIFKESGPELFMASLPPSLRILHIGMVVAWVELHRDLLGLSQKLYRFPSLTTVVIDPLEYVPDEQYQELKDAFAVYGVAFGLGRTSQMAFSKGMIGVRPGHPEPSEDDALTHFPL